MTKPADALRELFTRYEGNPTLKAQDWPHPANTVFNPGAVRLKGGQPLLLARVEDRRSVSHLNVVRSRYGLTNWVIAPLLALYPDPDGYPEEVWGVEDSRITWIEELDEYAVTYTAISEGGTPCA